MPSRKTGRQTNHIRQSKDGWWTFRRRVPAKLQGYLGKKEWKVALRTKNHAEAAVMAERHLQASEQAFMHARVALGLITDPIQITQYEAWTAAKKKLAGWDLYSSDVQDGYAMELMDAAEHGKLTPVEEQELRIINSVGKHKVNPTVQDAFDLYREEQSKKGRTEHAEKKNVQVIDRAQQILEASLGSLKLDITSVGRTQARAYKEALRKTGIAVGTANRYIACVAAVWSLAIREFELDRKNPFASLKDAEAGKDAKMPMSKEQIAQFITGTPEGELRCMVRLLAGTGARLGEIAGLKVEDVILTGNIPHLLIRPNEIRGLKTKSSERKVPLIGDALEAAREALRGAKDGWVFPSYYSKPSHTSASLSRLLRKAGIKDRKITTHSLRHSMVQALRDTMAPEVIGQALVGHAGSNAVNAAYGDGVALGVLRDALVPAVRELGLEC